MIARREVLGSSRAEAARFIGASPQRYEDWELKGAIPDPKHWPSIMQWLDVNEETLKLLVATTIQMRPLVQSALSEGWQ